MKNNNNNNKEKTDFAYLELFSEFKENVLNSKYLNDDPTQEPLSSDETIAKLVAAFCLENNIKAEKFNTLFRYQLVELLKKTDPEIANVQISARTGINRRGISSLTKTSKQTKDMLVLSYLKTYCQTNKTTHILKKGYFNSFESFCLLSANGTLTATAIAKELTRLGHLKDKGSRYQIVFDKEAG